MSIHARLVLASLLSLAVLWSNAPSIALAAERSLRDQVKALAVANGFDLLGLEQIRMESTRSQVTGTVAQQLDSLLADYKYLVFYQSEDQIIRSEGQILEVRIAGFEGQPSPSTLSLKVHSRQIGTLPIAVAEVAGPGVLRAHAPFFFDEGGKHIILPPYLLGALEFHASRLRSGWTMVENVRVPARLGRLPRLQIGSVVAHGIDVAFVEKKWTNGRSFIGTRSLEDFRVRFEEKGGEIFATTFSR